MARPLGPRAYRQSRCSRRKRRGGRGPIIYMLAQGGERLASAEPVRVVERDGVKVTICPAGYARGYGWGNQVEQERLV